MGRTGLPQEHRAGVHPGTGLAAWAGLGAPAPGQVALVSRDIGIHIHSSAKGNRCTILWCFSSFGG